jgi:hypothetical protein
MPLWTQHLVVIVAVLACLFAVGRQAFATLRGKPGKLGNCCAKGCGSHPTTAPEIPKGERVAFISSESLAVRARKRS